MSFFKKEIQIVDLYHLLNPRTRGWKEWGGRICVCVYVECLWYGVPEWSSGFPYFLQFKSEFGNKEIMVWATVSSWSCFCWLYRASPSLSAKNIINLILVLTIWWCPCVEVFCCVVGRGCLLWPVHFLGGTLLVFALLHSVFQGQICLLLQVFLDFLLLHSSPL